MRTLFALFLFLTLAGSAYAQADSVTYAIALLDQRKTDQVAYYLRYDNEQSENLGAVFQLKHPWQEFQESKTTMELKLLVYMKKKGFELVTNNTLASGVGVSAGVLPGPYRYEWTFRRSSAK